MPQKEVDYVGFRYVWPGWLKTPTKYSSRVAKCLATTNKNLRSIDDICAVYKVDKDDNILCCASFACFEVWDMIYLYIADIFVKKGHEGCGSQLFDYFERNVEAVQKPEHKTAAYFMFAKDNSKQLLRNKFFDSSNKTLLPDVLSYLALPGEEMLFKVVDLVDGTIVETA